MKKTDIPGGWPPDLVGYRKLKLKPFSLHVFRGAYCGMMIRGWTAERTWGTDYEIIHINWDEALAYGVRIPWYLCLRLTAANIGRWLRFQFRRLVRRKP